MRKLAKNQRMIYNDDWVGYGLPGTFDLEEFGFLFMWWPVTSISVPKDFKYDCTEEFKANMIDRLLEQREKEIIHKNKEKEEKLKIKNFKKCIKK